MPPWYQSALDWTQKRSSCFASKSLPWLCRMDCPSHTWLLVQYSYPSTVRLWRIILCSRKDGNVIYIPSSRHRPLVLESKPMETVVEIRHFECLISKKDCWGDHLSKTGSRLCPQNRLYCWVVRSRREDAQACQSSCVSTWKWMSLHPWQLFALPVKRFAQQLVRLEQSR